MSGDPIFENVKAILIEQLGIDGDSISPESSLIDDLNADSLDMVELVMAMEQEFGISIPDEEAERIKTVGDAIDFIKTNSQ
ncbi:MAG: acyl carrier protein [Clostridiaceae bacterium]|nr:acyl carrier protein [Clostridiaceae bacterium]